MVTVDAAMLVVDADVGAAVVVAEASTTLVQALQPREDCVLPLVPMCLTTGRRPLLIT